MIRLWPIISILFLSSYLYAQVDSMLLEFDDASYFENSGLTTLKLDTVDTATMYITSDSLSKLQPQIEEIKVAGKVYSAIITEEGDTLILADFKGASITSARSFESEEEYRKYLKFRRYANKVYPYAVEAIRIFREVEYVEANYSKKERKKKMSQLKDDLKREFEEPLSKLTKLQGKILIKMIERELDQNMYSLIKKVQGGFTAFYWHNFSKLYSYDLKEGYEYGKYRVLDIVLQDYDVSYELPASPTLRYVRVKEE